MGFGAQILADSISPAGVRLTTFEVTFPRIVLAEFNTHRMFSRNSASSRAIPVEKMIQRVLDDPYIPTTWGKNQRGMQAVEEVSGGYAVRAQDTWLGARNAAVAHARRLLDTGIHKQLTNRLLEPFMWHTVIVTATEWDNFFHLRNNAKAHPDIAVPAAMMQELYEEHEPIALSPDQWHLPLIGVENGDFEAARYKTETLIKVSVGRCARVSYLTHDGKRDLQADIDLHDRLFEAGHMSPFEHVARPITVDETYNDLDRGYAVAPGQGGPASWWSGNFRGWVQYRKTIPGEADILGDREATL